MNLDKADYAFLPFHEEAKEFYLSKYSLEDIFTEEALDIAVSRIKSGVIEDESRVESYTSDLTFKSYICAKTLLTMMDEPVYTYRFFKEESKFIINKYSVLDLSDILGLEIESFNPADPEYMATNSLAEDITSFDVESLEEYADRYYNETDPVQFMLNSDELESIFKGMFMRTNEFDRLYKIDISAVPSFREDLSSLRIEEGKQIVDKSVLEEYLTQLLMIQFAEKYPTPEPDVDIEIAEKKKYLIAQLPKISYTKYDEICTEYLPECFKSLYMKIQSNPELISEEEYTIFFKSLYRLGFKTEDMLDLFKLKTDIGENYIEELIRESNVSRKEEISDWSEIANNFNMYIQDQDDIYKSITVNPVEYYRLKAYVQ